MTNYATYPTDALIRFAASLTARIKSGRGYSNRGGRSGAEKRLALVMSELQRRENNSLLGGAIDRLCCDHTNNKPVSVVSAAQLLQRHFQ